MKKYIPLVIAFLLLNKGLIAQAPKTWLWKISGNGLKETSYLFGTFHEAGSSIFDKFINVKKNLSQTKLVMLETVTGAETLISATQEDVNKGYIFYRENLSPEDFKIFNDYIRKYNQVHFCYLNAFEIAVNLHYDYILDYCDNSKSVNDTIFGMDAYIGKLADRMQIPQIGLDDIIQLDTMRVNTSKFYYDTLDKVGMHSNILIMQDILSGKRNGYPCDVLSNYLRCNYLYDLKIVDNSNIGLVEFRNKKWVEIIQKNIKEKSCFIAVGFSHLRNSTSLINQLRQKGYNVVPIPMK